MRLGINRGVAVVVTGSLLVLAPGLVGAVDGVIEINQDKALTGGVTASDLPGFPVTIDTGGSYRLTSDLQVPDENTTGIRVLASDVTLDLNGFAIKGVTSCSGIPPSCSPTGSGFGVNANLIESVRVVNGTIRGMGASGVVVGQAGHIEDVRALENGDNGLMVQFDDAIVRRCVVRSNGNAGIRAVFGVVIVDSVADGNFDGISCAADCVITGNTATNNGRFGISAGGGSNISNNTAAENGDDGIFVLNGIGPRFPTGRGDCRIAGNSARTNGDDGIMVFGGGLDHGCLVIDNSSSANTGFGLNAQTNVSGYARNVFNNNNGGNANPQVLGGLQIGTNLCGTNTTCP